MKKIIFLILIFFTTVLNVQAEEIKRITVGNKDAKITIIAFESLTCSHCANFHKNVYPQLKEEYLDTGLAKIEFRHFPLDIAAFNASKVSQCKNDGNSDILESLYANQQKWVKGSSIEEANENLQKFLKNEGFTIDFDSFATPGNIEVWGTNANCTQTGDTASLAVAIAAIPQLIELNIGHAIIARAAFDGLHAAVADMRKLMLEARAGI